MKNQNEKVNEAAASFATEGSPQEAILASKTKSLPLKSINIKLSQKLRLRILSISLATGLKPVAVLLILIENAANLDSRIIQVTPKQGENAGVNLKAIEGQAGQLLVLIKNLMAKGMTAPCTEELAKHYQQVIHLLLRLDHLCGDTFYTYETLKRLRSYSDHNQKKTTELNAEITKLEIEMKSLAADRVQDLAQLKKKLEQIKANLSERVMLGDVLKRLGFDDVSI